MNDQLDQDVSQQILHIWWSTKTYGREAPMYGLRLIHMTAFTERAAKFLPECE